MLQATQRATSPGRLSRIPQQACRGMHYSLTDDDILHHKTHAYLELLEN